MWTDAIHKRRGWKQGRDCRLITEGSTGFDKFIQEWDAFLHYDCSPLSFHRMMSVLHDTTLSIETYLLNLQLLLDLNLSVA